MRLLSLDLSTAATGYSTFDVETKELLEYGVIKPDKIKGITKLQYPEKPLKKQIAMANALTRLVFDLDPDVIIIEEIAGSKNRIGQKTLDGAHYIFLDRLKEIFPLTKVIYYDVSGVSGWRKHLNMRQSDADKLHNREIKKLNKKLSRAQQIPKIGWKHLSCRHVNHFYKLDLNYDLRPTDGDIADSVSIGDAFLKNRFTEL